MKLRYIGISPVENGGTVPLPEGWPAADHDEDNEELAAQKVASGNYEAIAPAPASKPAADKE
jgi:hypothetical protein